MDSKELEEFKKLSLTDKQMVFAELKKEYDNQPTEENTSLLKVYIPILKEAVLLEKEIQELDNSLDVHTSISDKIIDNKEYSKSINLSNNNSVLKLILICCTVLVLYICVNIYNGIDKRSSFEKQRDDINQLQSEIDQHKSNISDIKNQIDINNTLIDDYEKHNK